jgi:hypothetical protein
MKARKPLQSLGAVAIMTIVPLQFVEANGGRFLVGLQSTDAALVRHLEAARIPFVAFDGAASYPGASVGGHWTAEGHKLVAERLLGLLSANSVPGPRRGAESIRAVPVC